MIQVASLAYRHNQCHNALQKYLSIYMQAQHLSKSVFYLLQQAGIVMSYNWTRQAIKVLDEDMRVLLEKIAKQGPLLIVHDNIRIEEPAASQRGDNQSVTDNGTAITVIHLPPSALALENCAGFKEFMHSLNACRMQGTAPKLSWEDLDQPRLLAYNRASSIHDILEILKKIPELSTIDWKAEKLKHPIGPKQLPHGPEHCVQQYMVPVVQIDETSYSGSSQVVPYTINKIGLHPIPEQIRLALERLFLWIGDQLTAQQCHQLQLMAHASVNSMEHMDPFCFIFGGFHTLMALGWSILENFWGQPLVQLLQIILSCYLGIILKRFSLGNVARTIMLMMNFYCMRLKHISMVYSYISLVVILVRNWLLGLQNTMQLTYIRLQLIC